ncbi:MAG: hypothetical protein IJX49_01075 [Clostridia bacterium]|nr:hypothetical protein [Clostridia bacterium]
MIFEIQSYESLRHSVEKLCEFLSSQSVAQQKIFDSKLVLYELLGNVLKHSEGGASLQGELVEGYVELRILAAKPFCPPEKGKCAEVYAENGRGWFLIDHLCAERIYTDKGEIFVRISIE